MTTTDDDAVLRRAVGTETLARGRHYARCGAVLTVQWSADGDRVVGQVRGNAARPYTAVAVVDPAADGSMRRFAGSCTCPVGTDCKHSVALALVRPRGRHAPSWEDRLALLDAAPSREPASPATHAGVALQFDTEAAPGRLTGLTVRPVLPGRGGGWVRTGVSWSTLHLHGSPAYGREQIHPEQLRLLAELRALDLTGAAGYWAGSGATLDLVGFASRRLWDVLTESVATGLPLVQAGKGARPVTVHPEPLEIALDAGRDDGRLVLRAAFTTADAPPPASVLLLGEPAHGVAWRPTPDELHLAPLRHDPDELVRELLAGEPLTIPAADEERFFTSYYPRLRRRMPLRSPRGDVLLPEPPAPTLVLRVTRPSARETTLSWQWRYGAGSQARTLPLAGARTDLGDLGADVRGDWVDRADPGGHDDPDVDDRDGAAEQRILAAVLATLSVAAPLPGVLRSGPSGGGLAAAATLRGLDAIRFATDVLPRLEQLDDLEITEVGAAADYRELAGATHIEFADATQDASRDWFDLSVRVTVGSDELPFEALFVALATAQSHLLLDDGRWLDLDRPELRELARVITEARSVHDQPRRTVRVSRYQAGLWAELEHVGQLQGPAAAWQRTVRALIDPEQLGATKPPAGLRAELRPYQLTGLRWLAFLFDNRLGGVLADDMGLGKTLQTLALVLRARQATPGAAPFLIVAPTTVMANWQAESGRFAPSLHTTVVTETFARRRIPLAEAVRGQDVVITSYTLFRLEHDAYRALPWSGLVLDEAQAAKNHLSRTYSCAKELDTPFKLAITGTPMENHLGELWSLLSIAAPGLFPTPARFEEYYRRPIERDHDAERLDSLRRRIRPVLLRRTKDQVAADLPDKQEQVLEVELHPRHRRAYDTLLHRERHKVLGLLDDLDGNRFEILRSLTILRQASLDIGLVDPDARAIPATKLDVLVELLTGIAADGHRTLVFSQFTRFLRAARDRLDLAGIANCYLDGSTRDRPAVIEGFRTGSAPVFLLSLKAGGVGLNLTEADYCVLLDPWWNPATEAQAIDRTHRIGQTRKVLVYRMVAKATIEEKVAALKDRKAALFADVLGDGTFSGARLSAADIRAMLD